MKPVFSLSLFFLILLSSVHSQKLIGDLEYYGAITDINDLTLIDEQLVISTNQGVIFFKSPNEQTLFSKAEGLRSVNIQQTLQSQIGIIALSVDGTVNLFNEDLQKFETLHTSYESSGFNTLRPKAISYGRYLIIPFKQGLSLFDLENRKSYLTITRVGPHLLENSQFKDIALFNDTLALFVNNQILTIPVDSVNIDSTRHENGQLVNIVDPNQWLTITDSITQSHQSLRYTTQLDTRPGIGAWFENNGETRALPYLGDTLIIQDKPVLDSILYLSLVDSTFQHKIKNAINYKEVWYLSSENQLYSYQDSARVVPLKASLPNANYSNLFLSDGVPYLWAGKSSFSLVNNNWEQSAEFPFLFLGPELFEKRARPFVVSPNRDVYVGSWGSGLQRSGTQEDRLYLPIIGDCLKGVTPAVENFPVITGLTLDSKGQVWFSNYSEGAGAIYTFGYLDKDLDEQMICYGGMGTGNQSAELQFNPYDSTELAVVHYSGVDLYDVQDNTPSLKQSLDAGHVKDIYQVEWDGQERMWLMGGDRLVLHCPETIIDGICFNQDFKDSLLDVSLIFGIQGGGFSSIITDKVGDLWVSTYANGAYRITASKDSIRGSDIEKFSKQTGLFSNEVYDIRPNFETGEIWFLHPDGITILQTTSRDTDEYTKKQIRVFPNPFRSQKHDAITFDQIPEDTEISIFNEARKLVKRISKEDIVGGYFRWDLKNQSGSLIKGGVYSWVAHGKKGNRIGHLIIVK